MTTVVGNGAVSVSTTVTDGTLRFGVELKNYQSNDCKFDHFTLEYLGSEKGQEQGGETDAINTQKKGTDAHSLIYDLNGRRMMSLRKGLNIVNGKKIVR